MSTSVEVTGMNIPAALMGVPLPIEAVSADGSVEGGVLTLQPGVKTTLTLPQPGNFLVRAKLPSGKWIAVKTTVEAGPDGGLAAPVLVGLDFGTAASTTAIRLTPPNTDREIPVGRPEPPPLLLAKVLPKSLSLLTDVTEGITRLSTAGVKSLMRSLNLDVSAIAEDAAPPNDREIALPPEMREASEDGIGLVLDYGLFQEWTTEPGGEESGRPRPVLVIQSAGTLTSPLPGSVKFPQIGAPPDARDWKPLLVRTQIKQGRGAPMTEALLVCPPSSDWKPMLILPDTDTSANPTSPPLHALTEGDDRSADALFSYVRNGSVETARQALPAYIAQSQEMLQAKVENPMTAALVGYALLRVGNTDYVDWAANLADAFPHIPDGPIILGWHRIRLGEAHIAGEPFHSALERGLPIYSEGIRLLRDGLKFLTALFPDAEPLRRDAALAYGLAASANLSSELTCLRIGEYFSVRLD